MSDSPRFSSPQKEGEERGISEESGAAIQAFSELGESPSRLDHASDAGRPVARQVEESAALAGSANAEHPTSLMAAVTPNSAVEDLPFYAEEPNSIPGDMSRGDERERMDEATVAAVEEEKKTTRAQSFGFSEQLFARPLSPAERASSDETHAVRHKSLDNMDRQFRTPSRERLSSGEQRRRGDVGLFPSPAFSELDAPRRHSFPYNITSPGFDIAGDSVTSTPAPDRLESRMMVMKRRFESLKLLSELDAAATRDMYATLGTDSSPLRSPSLETPSTLLAAAEKKASGKWSALRQVVAPKRGSVRAIETLITTRGVGTGSAMESEMELRRDEEQRSGGVSEELPMGRVPPSPSTDAAELPKTDVKELLQYWRGVAPGPPDLPVFSLASSFPLDEEEIRLAAPTGPALFLDEFRLRAEEALLEVHRVPEAVIQQRRDEMEALYVDEQRIAAEARIKEEASLVWREHGARLRIRDLEAEMWRKLAVEKEKIAVVAAEREQLLSWQFRVARESLEDGLARQKGEVRERYGEVGSDASARTYEVSSSHVPHPVEMRVHLLRAVKNKLPKAAYVVMLSMYDRLGGLPLRWSNIGSFGMGPDKPAVTRPIKHYGRYFDRVMRVEDSVFALCPPRSDLKPSFVFVIELFRLANRQNPKEDSIVGWAALPMCLENLGIVEGKYRIPMLKGQHSSSIEHFRDIDKAIGADLNNWLCNIYFEIRHLPQTILDTRNEIKYDFIHKKLEAKVAFKNAYVHEILYASGPSKSRKSVKNAQQGASKKNDEEDENDIEAGVPHNDTKIKKEADVSDGSPFNGLFNRKSGKVIPYEGNIEDPLDKGSEDVLEDRRDSQGRELVESSRHSDESEESEEDEVIEKGYNSADDFFLHPEVKGKLAGNDAVFGSDDKAWAKLSVEGKVIRRYQSDGSRYDSLAINPPKQLLLEAQRATSVKNPIHNASELMSSKATHAHASLRDIGERKSSLRHEWPPLDSEKDMEMYSSAMVQDPAQKKKIVPSEIVRSKLRYLMYEVFEGFSASDRWSVDFYAALLVMFCALWVRMFIHYLGQYLILQGMRVPVFGFTVEPHQISYKYISSGVSVSQEVLIVISGPLFNILFFLLLELNSLLIFRFVGHLPEQVSRFVVSYGFCTVFDPFLILVVDLIVHNYDCENASAVCKANYVDAKCRCFTGDFLKLYNRFKRAESSGAVGAIIVVILYISTFVISCFLLYEYLMHVHKDARILDLWRRITASEEQFLVPHDFEISYEELLRICGNRMNRWRGLDGSLRKLQVAEYVEEDPSDPDYQKTTTHYSIYEFTPNGQKKKIYRHFLMLPDGAIVEIFDKYQPALRKEAESKEEVVLSPDLVKSYKKSMKNGFIK